MSELENKVENAIALYWDSDNKEAVKEIINIVKQDEAEQCREIEIKEIIKKLEGLQRYDRNFDRPDFMGDAIKYDSIQLLIIELKEKL